MFVTTGQAGLALGCSIPTVRKLIATGVVPGVRLPSVSGGPIAYVTTNPTTATTTAEGE
ncbi:hypothetical protein [Kitasatospora sp. NPDC097643]|uniref:hypothetical protein n=1 Tax=Kitasatospora sp. NPDC097643 TaxID=3157230 RepID=UPI00332BAED8